MANLPALPNRQRHFSQHLGVLTMTDTFVAPPAAPAPGPGQFTDTGRSADQLAQDRQEWIGYGYDPAAFDRAVSGASRPGQPPAAADPSTDINLTARHAELRLASAQEFVGAYRAAHRSDAPEVDQAINLATALKAGGFTDAEVATLIASAAADTRSDDLKLASQGGLDAAPSPDTYGPISYPLEFTKDLAPGQLQGFDAEAKSAMVAMGVPALQGPSLVQGIVEAAAAYRVRPEAQQAAYSAQQDQMLVNTFGSRETANEAINLASALLAKCPTDFLQALQASGALRSATVIVQLANLADTANLRTELKAGRTFADVWRANRS
jgi:hypothetical protein